MWGRYFKKKITPPHLGDRQARREQRQHSDITQHEYIHAYIHAHMHFDALAAVNLTRVEEGGGVVKCTHHTIGLENVLDE